MGWRETKELRRKAHQRTLGKGKPLMVTPIHSLGYLGGSSVDLSRPDKDQVYTYRKNRIRFSLENINGILVCYGISLGDLGLFHSKLRINRQLTIGVVTSIEGRKTLKTQPDRVVITKTKTIPLCETTIKVRSLAIALDMPEQRLWAIIHKFLNQ